MSLVNDGSSNMIMPVAPMNGYGTGYGNGGLWGDGSFWIIILFLFAMMGNGWGGFGGFGGGGGAMPYMMNQTTNGDVQRGFDQQAVMSGINGITAGINSLAQGQCSGFAGVNATVNSVGNSINSNLTNGFYNAETAAANRQMANMNQMFGLQTGLSNQLNTIAMNQQQNSCDNRAAVADLKYTVATEACADRAAVDGALRDVTAQTVANTNALMNTMNAGIQSIKDQLCQDKIDAKNETIAQLRQEIAMKDLAASQSAQNNLISQGFANEVDQLYNRLNSCPVPTTPVYGRTPIFTCNQNPGMPGCGCGSY